MALTWTLNHYEQRDRRFENSIRRDNEKKGKRGEEAEEGRTKRGKERGDTYLRW